MVFLIGTSCSHRLYSTAFVTLPALQFKASGIFGSHSRPANSLLLQSPSVKPLGISAKANTRTEKAKIRNRRMQKKFSGSHTKPRLSVFCSRKQLYAMLIDDQKKKCLFYATTLQQSVRDSPPLSTNEAAERVGEKLIEACLNLNVNEISSYDQNGFATGERMKAFEVAISRHGLLPR